MKLSRKQWYRAITNCLLYGICMNEKCVLGPHKINPALIASCSEFGTPKTLVFKNSAVLRKPCGRLSNGKKYACKAVRQIQKMRLERILKKSSY